MPPLAFPKAQRSLVWNTVLFLAVSGVAMGFLEVVGVMYLRQFCYPEGFASPLRPMAVRGVSIECLRKGSTILMLLSVGFIAGRDPSERLAYF